MDNYVSREASKFTEQEVNTLVNGIRRKYDDCNLIVSNVIYCLQYLREETPELKKYYITDQDVPMEMDGYLNSKCPLAEKVCALPIGGIAIVGEVSMRVARISKEQYLNFLKIQKENIAQGPIRKSNQKVKVKLRDGDTIKI